jgi:hypothetical protein
MVGRWRHRAARAVAWIDDGWRRWLGRLGAWAAFGAVVTVVIVVWRILSFEIENTEEATSQGQLLVAAAGFLGTSVLVATTIYYAVQTKHLVDEARSAHERDEARHSERIRLERHREIEGTVAALQGASLDVVKSGSTLLTMRRHWRLWRVRQADPLMQAMTSASKATDRLRYLAAGPVSLAADELHELLLELMQLFMSGAGDDQVRTATEQMSDRKQALDEALATHVSAEASPQQ